ncbi:MAG: HypC/HybG/HupF family hydrogenase formation chaperone [Candidatus Coatesbacteria bacterium]
MCLAIPGRILSVEGEGLARSGVVDFAGVRKRISLSCLPGAAPGNYVMVHAGMAITVVDEAEALGVFEYIREAEAEGGSTA